MKTIDNGVEAAEYRAQGSLGTKGEDATYSYSSLLLPSFSPPFPLTLGSPGEGRSKRSKLLFPNPRLSTINSPLHNDDSTSQTDAMRLHIYVAQASQPEQYDPSRFRVRAIPSTVPRDATGQESKQKRKLTKGRSPNFSPGRIGAQPPSSCRPMTSMSMPAANLQ